VPTSATVTHGTLLTFTVTATDPDGPSQPLTFSLIRPPAGASIYPSTGVFTWTPTAGQVGNASFSVAVSDGQSQVVARPTLVTVN